MIAVSIDQTRRSYGWATVEGTSVTGAYFLTRGIAQSSGGWPDEFAYFYTDISGGLGANLYYYLIIFAVASAVSIWWQRNKQSGDGFCSA